MKSQEHILTVLRLTFAGACAVSLHSGPPEAGNEISYPDYARQAATFEIDEPAGAAVLAERVVFAECVGNKARVTHVGIWSEGALRYVVELPEPIEVGHLITPEFAAGAIRVTED